MKSTKLALSLAAALGVFGLFAAPSFASTPHFVTTGGPTKGIGGEQYFRLDPFHITCESAKPTGYVEAGEPKTLTVALEPKKCTTLAKLSSSEKYDFKLKTKFMTKFVIEYHANGFVEVGSEIEGAEPVIRLAGGPIELRVPALHDSEGPCILTIPEQTLPEKAEKRPEGEYPDALYSNEEPEYRGVFYKRLSVENNFTMVEFEYAGGQCEEFENSEELKKGRISGSFYQEVKKRRSLEWVQ